jgi:choline dehydrogenase
VVGGGAAGCVAGARLAEAASRSVLLLEAGPDLRANVPDAMRDGWLINRDHDWGYAAEPDARGIADDLRRGRLLGGTSWVTRFAVRGSPADYDGWAALGNPGWAFDDVLPYLKRLEADDDFGDRPWHGDAGPVPVTRYLEHDFTEVLAGGVDALEAAGFPSIDDHNRPGAVGTGRMPMTSRDGIRVTTADAYLPLGETPPNLTIRCDAQVDRVVFEGGSATGVRLLDGTAVESGWVVLCAGTYGSPAILMRSGVGGAEHLRSVEVDVEVDLPGVGTNLGDHPGVDIEFGSCGASRAAPILHLLTTFHSSGRSGTEAPDLMLWLSDPMGDPPSFEIGVGLLKPRSTGSVRLRAPDPAAPPRIHLPELRDPADAERLGEGYLRGLEVAAHPAIRRLCEELPTPGPTGDGLEELVRANAYSLPHVVGTCAMGPRPEDGAVVDASGCVHGAERLSIADASIIPVAPSAFTHIPTIMIAERLSESIGSLV